jgi:hypothetical protein
MEEDLQSLFSSLSWYQPEEEQEHAIQKLIMNKDRFINSLITGSTKDQWLNATKLIGRIEYSDQVRMVPQMLFLLRDMNWPGALEATRIMGNLNSEDLKPYIGKALIEANNENDTIWITWIKGFIEEIKVVELLEEYKYILNRAEW